MTIRSFFYTKLFCNNVRLKKAQNLRTYASLRKGQELVLWVQHRIMETLCFLSNVVWTQIFLNTEKKNPPFSKIPGYVWTVKYDSKTLRVDAGLIFKYGGKNLRFRKYPATFGRGLSHHFQVKPRTRFSSRFLGPMINMIFFSI